MHGTQLCSRQPADLDSVEGFTSASARTSLTNARGVLRLDPIDGVRYRLARPVSHHHGHLTEAFRVDWGLFLSFRLTLRLRFQEEFGHGESIVSQSIGFSLQQDRFV